MAKAVFLSFVIAILLVIAIPAYYVIPAFMFDRTRSRVCVTINRWAAEDNRLEMDWSLLRSGVETVYINSSVTPHAKLKELHVEVLRLDGQKRDRSTVEQLWDQLEASGHHGKVLISRARTFQNQLRTAEASKI